MVITWVDWDERAMR